MIFLSTPTQETDAISALGEDLKELQEFGKPDVLMDALKGWVPDLIRFGLNLLVILVIFIVGRKIIRLLLKMARHSFERAGMEIGVTKFIGSLLKFSLNALLIFIIAGQLGIDSASIVAILGSAGLAIGLALQESLKNFAGGILILVMKPFKVGDYIVMPNAEGTVSVIGLVYTILVTIDNKTISIPNGTLSNSIVTNVTAMEKRRLDLTVGIGYQSDLRKAKEIMDRIYRQHPSVLQEEPIVTYVDSLGDDSVVLGARGWTKSEDYWAARWDITEKIKKALRFRTGRWTFTLQVQFRMESKGMIRKAAVFAANAHKGAVRKGGNIPYITHPLDTALIVSSLTEDEELIAAAILHDTIEDAGVTFREIEGEFGRRVAELVAGETEDKSRSWRERKQATIDRLKGAGRDEKILALGDKLSNLRNTARDYLLDGDAVFERFNMKEKRWQGWYYTSMAEAFKELESFPEYREYVRLCQMVFGE